VKLDELRSDPREEREGDWYEYLDTGIEVRISPAGTAAFDRRVRELMRPHLKATQKKKGGAPGDVSQALEDSINKRAVAELCVHEFRGLTEDDGETAIEYSVDRCLEIFNDPRLYQFWSWIWRIANLRSGRAADSDELGNSSSSSAGGLNGGETSNS